MPELARGKKEMARASLPPRYDVGRGTVIVRWDDTWEIQAPADLLKTLNWKRGTRLELSVVELDTEDGKRIALIARKEE